MWTRLPALPLADSRRLLKPLLLALAMFYLAFHSISGDRGLVAWFRESKKLESLNTELALISQKREAYERHIRLLKSDSIDLDMLDEQARRVLGVSAAEEVVVFEER